MSFYDVIYITTIKLSLHRTLRGSEILITNVELPRSSIKNFFSIPRLKPGAINILSVRNKEISNNQNHVRSKSPL